MNDDLIHQNLQTPTENEIEEILIHFNPVPSESYHNKMQTAPWKKTSSWNIVTQTRATFSSTSQPIRIAILVSSILILTIIGYTASPTISAAAKQFISFFIPAETDTISIPITVGQDGDLIAYDAPGYFSMDIATLTELIEFDLLGFPEQLLGLKYSGTNYNKETSSVTTQYLGAGKTIYFTQRPTESMLEFSSIGASAPVELVMIKNLPGEYVVGGWRAVDDKLVIAPEHMLEISEKINIYWDPNLSQRIMRWEENGITYEILAIGQRLSKSVLLELAESLTPLSTK